MNPIVQQLSPEPSEVREEREVRHATGPQLTSQFGHSVWINVQAEQSFCFCQTQQAHEAIEVSPKQYEAASLIGQARGYMRRIDSHRIPHSNRLPEQILEKPPLRCIPVRSDDPVWRARAPERTPECLLVQPVRVKGVDHRIFPFLWSSTSYWRIFGNSEVQCSESVIRPIEEARRYTEMLHQEVPLPEVAGRSTGNLPSQSRELRTKYVLLVKGVLAVPVLLPAKKRSQDVIKRRRLATKPIVASFRS